MGFFSRFSPGPAYRDLRRFLATREPHDLGFFALAIVITAVVVWAFFKDSNIPVPYKRDIIYVQQWRLDRTDAQIKVQQAIDQAAKERREAAEAARREKLRLEFKRLDDSLTNMGI